MIISLIGMSGVGKSLWAKKLEKEKGFIRYSCDEFIEKDLALELSKLGYDGITGVSKWMGQPYDERYTKNSKRYLELEEKSMELALADIKKEIKDRNIVIDTTGSVIYLSQKLLEDLKKYTKIIYLSTPEKMVQEMVERYLKDPKPVFWGKAFKPLENEDGISALKRCYSNLLKYRQNQYSKLAEVDIDYYKQFDRKFKTDDLLSP